MKQYQVWVRRTALGEVVEKYASQTYPHSKQHHTIWAFNRAANYVEYENQWGADLFIDYLTDSYGQDRIDIWDKNSTSQFPLFSLTIWGRE